MKYIYFSICSFLWAFNAFGQKYPEGKVQQISAGAFSGYESNAEALLYGAGIQYEYRPFKRWGFTLGATYDTGPYADAVAYDMFKDAYKQMGINLPENTLEIKQSQLAFHTGARFYISRFFISAGLGWSFLEYTLRDKNTKEQENGKADDLYYDMGVGYQWILNDKHILEPFYNSTTGWLPKSNGTPKVVLGMRYAFRFK